jgi:hypothetical protein
MSVRISLLALVACAPEPAPIVAPMAAPPDLEVTMDPGVHGMLEDEARRHAPPPAALRQRVYHVERRFFRWFHPGPGEPRRNWNWPLKGEMADFPADRVALQGQPPPVAGERFVLFDATGPRGVVEATGERCPPGHDDCIACTEHDPLRRPPLPRARRAPAVPRGAWQAHRRGARPAHRKRADAAHRRG